MPIAACICTRKNRAPDPTILGGGCNFDFVCGPKSTKYNDEQHYAMLAIRSAKGCETVTTSYGRSALICMFAMETSEAYVDGIIISWRHWLPSDPVSQPH
jgi:hypothetical protein